MTAGNVSTDKTISDHSSISGSGRGRGRAGWARGSALTAKGLVGMAVLAGAWQLVVASHVLRGGMSVSTAGIMASLVRGLGPGPLQLALLSTIEAWALGLALCVIIGVVVGCAIGLSRWADALTSVVVDFLRPVPSVALVPIVVVFFGIELNAQVVLVVLASVWPIIFNTRYGVRNVDPLWLDEARLMGVTRAPLLARVVLRAALPSILTGVRTASSIAITVAVAAELVVGSPGLGYFVDLMQQADRMPEAYAGIIAAGLFGYLADGFFRLLERWVAGWHRGATEPRS